MPAQIERQHFLNKSTFPQLSLQSKWGRYSNMSNKNSKNDIQTLGEAIRDMLNSYRLTSKFDEATLINSWERIAGKPIAKRTKKISIRNKVLFVELDSPSMKHDFSLHKTQVLEMFKKEFGSGIISDIVVM